MSDLDLAWRVEEACLNAFPSPREMLLRDRWLVRIAGGATRRINAVNPLRAEAYDPTPVIDVARRLYRARGTPLLFRVPKIARGLDQHLERAGFTAGGTVSTLVATLDAGTPDKVVALAPEPSAAWLAAKFRMSPQVGAVSEVYRATLAAILLPAAFAALSHEGRVVAVAYGAVHEDILVLESVVTDPLSVRRGHGRRVVGALLAWARELGATTACLQVESDNGAAVALYRGLGFTTDLYTYRYRRDT